MNEHNHDAWVRKILSQMPSGLRLLDAGAGSKKHEEFCSHLKYVSQDFCEYDGKGNEVGLQRGKKEAIDIDIISDITSIPEPDSSFDIILCTGVFEHIPDPIAAIKEFNRLLCSGGFLILTAPFCSLTHYAPYHYYSGFNRYFYEKFLPENDFKILSKIVDGSFFEFLMVEIKRLEKVAFRYADSRLSSIEKNNLSSVFELLLRLCKKDKGSHELLCGGYLMLAVKL